VREIPRKGKDALALDVVLPRQSVKLIEIGVAPATR
jgi:hypothetical protein